MVILNKQTWHNITKYSQPDCQETKTWHTNGKFGVSGPHKLSHGRENQPGFSTQNSVMLIYLYFTFFYQVGAIMGNMQHWLIKTHTHIYTNTHKLYIYDSRNFVRNKMLKHWLYLHVDNTSVNWAYYHARLLWKFNSTNCSFGT